MVEVPKSVKQGGVIKIVIRDDDSSWSEKAYVVSPFFPDAFSENDMPRFPVKIVPGLFLSLIPISVTELPGKGKICVTTDQYHECHWIEIEKADFPVSDGVSFVGEPSGKLKKKFDGEKAELKRIFVLVTPERFWKEDLKFSPPLKEMAVTSPFGKIRHKISNKDGKWDVNHFGVDLRADVGTLVYAAEKGVVRIAANFLAEGNMVFIDHGYGLVSLYFHLSRLKVKKGEVVKKGEEIGRSGQTGAAIGPHLHFEIRLYGIAVSSWNFIAQPPMFEQKAVPPPVKKHSAVKPSKKRGRK